MARGLTAWSHNGDEYKVNDSNIADEFRTTLTYSEGQYVYYGGTLYKFTQSHPAGAWNAGHVIEVLVMEEIGKGGGSSGSGDSSAKANGSFILDKSNFDIGNATGDSDGFIYTDDADRVRTKPGYTIHLDEGYTISLSDFTKARFFFHRRNMDGTYTHTNWRTSPYYTVNEGDYVITIEGIPATAQTTVDELFGMLSITYKNSQVEVLEKYAEKSSGKAPLHKEDVELGNIGVSNSGWTYQSSESRLRLREGVTLHMFPGDSFGLADYSGARYFYGYKLMNGTYVASGWMTSGMVAEEECDLVFVIEKIPEGNIYNIDDLYELIRFQRAKTHTPVAYDFKAKGIRSICHQGYNRVAPENTLPAFALAKVMGFDFVETDIQFSSDNVPVLCHDTTIDDTSDGSGLISSMTYEQLLQYDFGSWKSAEYAGTRIPTLEQFFALCNAVGLFPYAEVPDGMTEEQAKIVVDAARKYSILRGVTWISFSIEALQLVVNEDPGARVLAISTVGDSTNFVRKVLSLNTGYNEVGVDQHYTMAETYREIAIQFGLPVEVWTVSSLSDMQNLPDFVVGVTSDIYPISMVRAAQQLTLNKPAAYGGSISGIEGGYYIKDNRVTVSMAFTGATTAGTTTKIATGLPTPKRNQAVTILAMSGNNIAEQIPGFVATDGSLYAGKVTSETSYVLTGEYILL